MDLSPFTVLGVDPGLTTGLAMIRLEASAQRWVISGSSHLQVHAVDAGPAMLHVMHEHEDHGIPVRSVAVERFIITGRTATLTAQPHALEVTGVVKYLANAANLPLFLITKANAIKFASDAQLKVLGVKPRALPHAADATRIALAGLLEHRADVYKNLLY